MTRDLVLLGDDDNPAGRRQEHCLAILGSAPDVEVDAGKEDAGDDPIYDMEKVLGAITEQQLADSGGALHEGQAGHQQVGRAEASAEGSSAKVLVSAPQSQDDRENDKSQRKSNVKEADDAAHGVRVSVRCSTKAQEAADCEEKHARRSGHPTRSRGERLKLGTAAKALDPLDPLSAAQSSRRQRPEQLSLPHFRPPLLIIT